MHRINDVSKNRERELAKAKYERQLVRRSTKANRVLLYKISSGSIFGLAVIGYLVLQANSADANLEPTAQPSYSASAPIVAGCQEALPPRPDNITFPSAPEAPQGASELTLETNCGEIVIQTNSSAAATVGYISFLANNKFYDGTKCHRLTTNGIFVLQCGDPAGNGSGGPGFQFDDENLPNADSSGIAIYPRGTVAMANNGPNTNGSQFFLVYQDSPLPPNYSVWGQITSGLDLIDAIAAAGVIDGQTDGEPSQEVVINAVTITP